MATVANAGDKPTRNGARGDNDEGKTWQQTKSGRTRTTILNAAIDCFYELGSAPTTTERIAQQAGVSRGAMLHHFHTRRDLLQAAIEQGELPENTAISAAMVGLVSRGRVLMSEK